MNRAGFIDNDPIQFSDEASDSESIVCEPSEGSSLLQLDEGSEAHVHLKHHYFLSIGPLAERCSLVAIRRIAHWPSAMGKARIESFKAYAKALAEKNGGNPNLKLGWYASSSEGVRLIATNGFGSDRMPDLGPFGFSICIHAGSSAANCVLSSVADSNEFRHIVFCRVILGKTECVLPGSKQHGPSSDEFDSGVDNELSPKKFIVWYSDAKTRVLPLYALIVRLDTQFKERKKEILARPKSPWISFSKLIYTLSERLSSSD